jgi:uncharacterized protein (TIGR04255 family)
LHAWLDGAGETGAYSDCGPILLEPLSAFPAILLRMTDRPRPSFEDPPVIEVVCGIQFATLALLQAPHLGLYWNRIRDEFPRCQSKPPLPPAADVGQVEVTLEFGTLPPIPRVWFISDRGDALVQLQQDRFLYNWKRADPSQPYPRYPAVLQRFRALFEGFVAFLEEHALGDIRVNQLELTYVNHMVGGAGWQSYGDVGVVLPDHVWRQGNRYLPIPAAFTWRTRFDMPNERGRLHIAAQSGRRKGSDDLLLRLDLTARGMFDGDANDHLWKWFDEANSWIVQGFIDVTGADMQKHVWRRTA